MTASNYPAIVAAIVATLERIVTPIGGLKAVLAYEPQALRGRMFYFILQDFDLPVPATGNEIEYLWQWAGRLVIEYTNNERAEEELGHFVPAIVEALRENLSADGAIVDGMIAIAKGKASYLRQQQILYRVVDFELGAVERVSHTPSL